MYEKTLTKNTKSVLESIGKSDLISNFYLAGGTALALYYGHRISVDLDWFSKDFSNNPSFRNKLSKLGSFSIDSEDENTLNGSLDDVKVSFFEYPYPLISDKNHYKDKIYLAGRPDIAVMKMEAVSGRGTYKDFIDIYFLLKEYGLDDIFNFLKKKFKNIEYNKTHILKSLTYFEDAEESIFPEMIDSIEWEEVKKTITSKVENYINNSV